MREKEKWRIGSEKRGPTDSKGQTLPVTETKKKKPKEKKPKTEENFSVHTRGH